jgi:hypothetical protein
LRAQSTGAHALDAQTACSIVHRREEGKAYLAKLNAQKQIGQPDEIARHDVHRIGRATGHILTVNVGKSAG